MDQLIQQRRDTGLKREREDYARLERLTQSGNELEQSHSLKIATLKATQASAQRKELSDQLAHIDSIKARQRIELADFQYRQAQEVAFQERVNQTKLSETRQVADTLLGEVLRRQDAEAREQSGARQREEEEVREKRLREDGILKDELLKMLDEEAGRAAEGTPSIPKASQPTPNNKRTFLNKSLLSSTAARPALYETEQGDLRRSKRSKPTIQSQPERIPKMPSTSTRKNVPSLLSHSPSLALRPEPAPEKILCRIPEYSASGNAGLAIKTSFELRYISGNISGEAFRVVWHASPGAPIRTLRANGNNRTFEPFVGEVCMATQRPEWVLNAAGSKVRYDRAIARMIVYPCRSTSAVSLKLEFKDTGEFDAFFLLFAGYYEGHWTRCDEVVCFFFSYLYILLKTFIANPTDNRKVTCKRIGSI